MNGVGVSVSFSHLAVRGRVDAVVVDAALVAQRDGPLSRAALALAHQKAAVDAAAQQVLGGVAGHGSVVPAVLLQAVDGRDVVAGNPALAVLGLRLAPLAIVIVSQNPQLLSWSQREKRSHSYQCLLKRSAEG